MSRTRASCFPQLAAKQPHLLHSETFEFEDLLSRLVREQHDRNHRNIKLVPQQSPGDLGPDRDNQPSQQLHRPRKAGRCHPDDLGRKADFVVFSSVLKRSMPLELRETALTNAACVLAPGGSVIIFTDCVDENVELARKVGLVLDWDFQPLFGNCSLAVCRNCRLKLVPTASSPTLTF